MAASTSLPPVEAIFRECFRTFAALPNAITFEADDLFAVLTEAPLTFFNGVAFSRFTSDVEARIDAAVEPFRSRRQAFRWWILPSTEPRDTIERLRARGFRHTYDADGMHADLRRVPLEIRTAPDVTIIRVEDTVRMEEWVNVLLSAFGHLAVDPRPWVTTYDQLGLDGSYGWSHYAALIDDRVVATSSVLLSGSLAGIYHVATLPEARGRGIGSAVTLRAMRDAREAGATDAVLQSSAMGASVYRALGYQKTCDLTLYDWRPEYESAQSEAE